MFLSLALSWFGATIFSHGNVWWPIHSDDDGKEKSEDQRKRTFLILSATSRKTSNYCRVS